MFVSGCSSEMSGEEETHEPMRHYSSVPLFFEELEWFLEGVSMAKFMEELSDPFMEQYRDFNMIFAPAFVPEYMNLDAILASSYNFAFWHSCAENMDNLADFIWSRTISPEVRMNDPFRPLGRDAVGHWIEHNGITYAVGERRCHLTGEFDGYMIAWVQHGQSFTANTPAHFTLTEALAFSYAVPITTWQLDGDALSVSVQGMSDVTIHDSAGNEIIAIDDMLFREINGDMEKVGYRWQISERSQRYQYVLQPGRYLFFIEGVVSEPGLLVKHFEGGEISSSKDFAEELGSGYFNALTITITSNPDESYLDVAGL